MLFQRLFMYAKYRSFADHKAIFSLNSNIRPIVHGMAHHPKVVFVLGGPGAGKGTQCQYIVEVSQICYLQVAIERVERQKIIVNYIFLDFWLFAPKVS